MKFDLEAIPAEASFDVIVIGAGGAGMYSALLAAIDGAKVLLVESTEYVGGTTAYSAGTTWIPNTPYAKTVANDDSIEKARGFLQRAVGDRSDEVLRMAFLENGSKAVEKIEAHSHVKYQVRQFHPDYLSELEGSTLRGRAIEPRPYDGRKLGDNLSLIRPPIPEFTVHGGMMVDRDDIAHLLGMKKSLKSLMYSIRIIARHAMDRMKHPRGTRLVMGNALIGRLLQSLLERNVSITVRTRLESLLRDPSGAVSGVVLSQGNVRRTLVARGGVILASGGFNRHPTRRAEMLPGADVTWCPAAPGHTGEAHDIALAAGASYGTGALSNAFWAPVSVRKRADGTTAVFPHFIMDRGKPGMVTVNQQGRRFVNESTSYHLFGIAMQEAHKTAPSVPAWLITDAEALKRYGIGMVRPGGKGLAPFLADGYLIRAASLDALARQLGIDPAVLKDTVSRMNSYVATGVDPEFHRGETDYQRANGDATLGLKNPNLGMIDKAPFYAIRLYPGDIGAATGLRTDAAARVLGRSGSPIAGLYAVGNDMHSIMGGTYPAPGITLGPALTFAFIAARDAVARSKAGVSAPAGAATPMRQAA